jgi:hypothetical protein
MLFLLVVASGTFSASALYAQKTTDSPTFGLGLTIFLETSRVDENSMIPLQKRWMASCQVFKALWENRNRVMGAGPFQKVSCNEKFSTLAEERQAGQNSTGWLMRVIDSDKTSGFEVYFIAGKNDEPLLEASYYASGSPQFMTLLAQSGYLENMALILSDQLPFWSLVKIKDNGVEIAPLRLTASDLSDFVIYTLSFDDRNKRWLPRVVSPVSLPPAYRNSNSSSALPTTLALLSIRACAFQDNENVLFAHSRGGRTQGAASARRRVAEFERSFGMSALKEPAPSDHFSGMRYGFSIFQDQSAIKHSIMLSLFTEMRSGPLNGLRVSYDASPQTAVTTSKGYREYLEWESVTAGWALALPLPQGIKPYLSRLDIYPKIGLFYLKGELLLADDKENEYLFRLDVKKKTFIGLELDAEWQLLRHHLLRAWISYGRIYHPEGIKHHGYLSSKAGADIYWDLFVYGQMRLKLLTFIMASHDNTVGTVTRRHPAGVESDSLPVALALGYAGAGLILAW